MSTKLALIYQISARCKKLVAGCQFISYAKLVHALQYLSGKLASRYNYIPDVEDFGQLMPAS
jgi:hypothetical protein